MYKGDYCKLCGEHKLITGSWMAVCTDCVRELELDRAGYIRKLANADYMKVYVPKKIVGRKVVDRVPETTSGSSFSK